MTERERPPRWAGPLFVLVGGAIVLVAADVIPVDASSVHAPRWVLAAAGAAFALAGVAVTAQARGVTGNDPRYALLAALLVTVFAAPLNWIAFGAGERQFSGGLSFLGVSLFGGSGEVAGRIAFGIGAVLVDVMALLAWRDFLRKL